MMNVLFAKMKTCRVALAGSAALLTLSLTASAVPVSLGGASDYAILGEGGAVDFSDFKVYQSGTVIDGNVGMGPHSELTHNIDATINGRFDYDLTSTLGGQKTTGVTGGINQITMTAIVADARAASALAASFAPTQTFTKLSENQVIIGGAGLNVIRITGNAVLKTGLTLSGTASSQFIFQFTSPATDGHNVLTLSGMSMTLAGGVLGDNILWNLNGIGGGVMIKAMAAGQTVYGTFLAPDRDILADHAIVQGRLIGGGSGNLVSVHSGSEITAPISHNVPDGGSTVVLLGVTLACLGGLRTKFAQVC